MKRPKSSSCFCKHIVISVTASASRLATAYSTVDLPVSLNPLRG